MNTEHDKIRQNGQQVLLVVSIVLGGFLSLYNSVAMNVAIPTFVRVFGTDLGQVQWIMISYTLMIWHRLDLLTM